jgi:hypothetical protein
VRAALLLILVAGVGELVATTMTVVERSEGQRRYYEAVEKVRSIAPRYLVMQPGRVLGAQYQDPLRVEHDRLPSVPGGWTIFSPRYYAFLREHGLRRGQGVIPRLITAKRAYLISNKRIANLLERYTQMTYSRRVRAVKILDLDERTAVWEMRLIGSKVLNR